jgi:hypothetical protein
MFAEEKQHQKAVLPGLVRANQSPTEARMTSRILVSKSVVEAEEERFQTTRRTYRADFMSRKNKLEIREPVSVGKNLSIPILARNHRSNQSKFANEVIEKMKSQAAIGSQRSSLRHEHELEFSSGLFFNQNSITSRNSMAAATAVRHEEQSLSRSIGAPASGRRGNRDGTLQFALCAPHSTYAAEAPAT